MAAKSDFRNVVSTGGFSEGSTLGSGQARSGIVKTAGFDQSGSGTGRSSGTGSGGGGLGTAKGGFDIPAAAASTSPRQSASATTPVEITFKPKPAYTEQARNQGVEGEVLLEVRFCSTGRVEVLRVVRGLGFGLDEAASAAAAQIHFRPSLRDGAPVDTQGIVHIVFQRS